MSHYRPKDGKDGLPGTHGKDGRDGDKGDIGPIPAHDWVGTNIRFENPDGEWGEFVDLEGPKGEKGDSIKGDKGDKGDKGEPGKSVRGPKGDKGDKGSDGDKGDIGPMPDHQWRDTSLRFEEPDGTWGRYVNLKGEKGDPGPPGSSGGGMLNPGAIDHNRLGHLQGGQTDQFYHLTQTQNTDVSNISTGGTNAQFWRGDKVYSNELEGPFSARALVDTATLGPELVTNGTFTGGLASWAAGVGWVGAANTAVVTVVGAGNLSQNIAVIAGTPYLLTFTQQHSASNNGVITPSIGAVNGVASMFGNTGSNSQAMVIIANATGSLPLTFTVSGAGAGTITLDTVSVVAVSNIPFTIELENAAGTAVNELRSTSVTSNVYMGNTSGRSTTAAANNTFIGNAAGRSNTTGSNNTFIGSLSGQNNTTASANTFFGVNAGLVNTVGANNTFLGNGTGLGNTTGMNNTCVGNNAGQGNNTGINNTFFGVSAGLGNTTGSGNSFLGVSCGRFQADGVTILTDPENSVYLGSMVRGFDNNDSNSIVVGANAIGRGPNTAQWGNTSIINHYFSGSIQYGGKVLVAAKSGFPTPVAGVITLANNTEYELLGAIDLTGDRIVCGTNNSISGGSFAASSLTSTGLGASAKMITSTSSVKFENISLSAPTGELFDLNDSTGDLLITGVQITGTPVIGTIRNYGNIVCENFKIISSANMTVTGTIGSFATLRTLFAGLAGQTTLIIPAAAVITRRISILYSAVETPATGTGFSVSTSATIPDEGYNIDNTQFSGSGTAITGLDYTSNESIFFNNKGITNTSVICQYSMTGNATATTISATGTFVKVAGTTTASALNQKFTTGTTQRATYAGVLSDSFRVSAVASMTSGNNQNIRMRIAKNGTTIAESQSSFKTTGSGDASAIFCQTFTTLAPTDYIEVFITNDTATTAITVTDLNVNVLRIN